MICARTFILAFLYFGRGKLKKTERAGERAHERLMNGETGQLGTVKRASPRK